MEKASSEQEYLPKEHLHLPEAQKELPEHIQHSDVKTLLSWHAPGRPFRKRQKEYFINMLILMMIIQVILFLFSQYFLMLLVVALVFVTYALNTIPPHDFRYRISTEGITIEDYFFLWQELYDFYFQRRDDVDVLIVRVKAYLGGELTITLSDIHKDQIKAILLAYLPYREYVRPTFMEKSGEWIARTFPLEKSPHTTS